MDKKADAGAGRALVAQELKDVEEKIMGADEKILALEERLFMELVTFAQDFIRRFRPMPTPSHGSTACFRLPARPRKTIT